MADIIYWLCTWVSYLCRVHLICLCISLFFLSPAESLQYYTEEYYSHEDQCQGEKEESWNEEGISFKLPCCVTCIWRQNNRFLKRELSLSTMLPVCTSAWANAAVHRITDTSRVRLTSSVEVIHRVNVELPILVRGKCWSYAWWLDCTFFYSSSSKYSNNYGKHSCCPFQQSNNCQGNIYWSISINIWLKSG